MTDGQAYSRQGSEQLYDFRKQLVPLSIQSGFIRLEREKQWLQQVQLSKLKQQRLCLYEKVKSFSHIGSQCPSSRPLSWTSFSKFKNLPETCTSSENWASGTSSSTTSTSGIGSSSTAAGQVQPLLATATWDGQCSIWQTPSLSLLKNLQPHTERATCIEFYPDAQVSFTETPNNSKTSSNPNSSSGSTSYDCSTLALASADILGFVHFHSLTANATSSSILSAFQAHPLRISSLAFHPLGSHLITTSYDTTWKLFDLSTQQEILVQEGHAKEVFCQSCHPDSGALLATAGLDANVAIWDLRLASPPIALFQEHTQGILSLDWSANGFLLATASEDNTIKIWDLRKKSSLETIFAHTASVTTVKFVKHYTPSLNSPTFPSSSDTTCSPQDASPWLLSTSHDHTAKIWGAFDWKCLLTLTAHENKIVHADISQNGKYICTAGFDKSIKLWSSQ